MNCLQCGKPCPPSRRARPRRFCTDRCRILYNNAKRDRKGRPPDDWKKRHPERAMEIRRRWELNHPETIKAVKRRRFQRIKDSLWLRRQLKKYDVITPELLDKLWQRRRTK